MPININDVSTEGKEIEIDRLEKLNINHTAGAKGSFQEQIDALASQLGGGVTPINWVVVTLHEAAEDFNSI